MHRRDFFRTVTTASASLALLPVARLLARVASDDWRTFEMNTRVEVLKPSGPTRIWVPAALTMETPYQRTLSNTFEAPQGTARLVRLNAVDGLAVVAAEFSAGATPALSVTSRVSTRDVAVDPGRTGRARAQDRATLDHFLRPTKLIPTDGIVKATAEDITRGATTDVIKARAIYEWIVDNTKRNPQTRGCGLGDIRYMLQTKDLTGKCADLNALFVGLSRAAGLPARDVYGIRTGPSARGYKSLGTSSSTITKAQHCRAEVYLTGHGWVPVDPADVRKVALEEPPGNRTLDDEMVRKARAGLFGSWEMNWVAYNFGHDVALPGSKGAPIGFFMYPQAETDEGRLDSLNPDTFRYEITARQVED
jgi:transglutaminase-like putative cysteine protease